MKSSLLIQVYLLELKDCRDRDEEIVKACFAVREMVRK
jgi:hypothetical protein